MTAIFFMLHEQDIESLQIEWEGLSSAYTSDTAIQTHSFQVLRENYSEKSRSYHNLSHVNTLLGLFKSLASKIQDPSATQFAIWFHDVIYNTKRNDNEEESARLAAEMLYKLQVSTETVECVQKMILATKTHGGRNLSEDAKLFLDMDLAILGARAEIYKEYSQAIRKEYSWASEAIYRGGRKKVLEDFLLRERIYQTEEMGVRFEERARENIISEIKSLNA